MDSLTTQKPKSRKVKRVAKKSRVEKILDLFFRAIEIVVVLITLAKLCYELVMTFQDSGVAEVILANRTLAFVLGNAIVLGLVAKSGLFLNQEVDHPKCKRNDIYQEFIRESSRRDGTPQSLTETETKQSEAEEEKQSVTENRAKQSVPENRAKQSVPEKQIVTEKKMKQRREKQNKPEKMTKQIIDITVKMEKQNLSEKKQIQSYQRSKSENLEGVEKSAHGRLRRSETDTSSEIFDSDDELRYKIESFIARQRRNQNDD